MDTDPQSEQRNDVRDQDSGPTMTSPHRERPDAATDELQPDPGPAKNHGDPLTDIDDEMRTGGGGND